MWKRTFCLMISLAAWSGISAGAQENQLVKATLLADVSAVAPGRPFTVGVLLEIEPQWHIYWINPGDSGMATFVQFKAPPGFEVGEVRYPLPVKFVQPGDVLGYGYKERVLLLAEVTPPPDLGPETVRITAEAEWLSCREICIRGDARPQLELAVAADAQPADDELFAQWKDRFPAHADEVIDRLSDLRRDGEPGDQSVELRVHWKRPPAEIQWAALASDEIILRDLTWESAEYQTQIRFQVVFPGADAAREPLPLFIAYTDHAGRYRGVQVSIP